MQAAPIQLDECTFNTAKSLASSMKCSIEEVVRRAVEQFAPTAGRNGEAKPTEHPGLALMKQWADEPDSNDAEELAALQSALDAERERVGARRLFINE